MMSSMNIQNLLHLLLSAMFRYDYLISDNDLLILILSDSDILLLSDSAFSDSDKRIPNLIM